MSGHFVKLFTKHNRILSDKLPEREWAAFTRLALWVRFRDNTIMSRTGKGPMRQAEIALVIGKGLRQTKDILAELERRGVLESHRDAGGKVYSISELLVYRGTKGDIEGARPRARKSGEKVRRAAPPSATGRTFENGD